MRPKSNLLLPLAAIFSLLFGALLICGYFGRFDATLADMNLRHPNVRTYCSFESDRGMIGLRATNYQLTSPILRVLPNQCHLHWDMSAHLPRLSQCKGKFDAQSITDSRLLCKYYMIEFPIWCGLLLCLISPWMWIRKRRQPAPTGFDVIASPILSRE
jgi:hypothetical protein